MSAENGFEVNDWDKLLNKNIIFFLSLDLKMFFYHCMAWLLIKYLSFELCSKNKTLCTHNVKFMSWHQEVFFFFNISV